MRQNIPRRNRVTPVVTRLRRRLRIGIIGYGRFGRLWAKILRRAGHHVSIFDPRMSDRRIEVDFLFLMVPISAFAACCRRVRNLVSSSTVVVDACSVKCYPARVMRREFTPQQPLIATHSLFGPDSVARSGLAGKKIVVCTLRASRKQQTLFESVLQDLRLTVIHATPTQHDQQMAKSQALVHFIGRALERLRLRSQQIATPDYEALRAMCALVSNDTWTLFSDMQRFNRFSARMRQAFVKAVLRLDASLRQPAKTLLELRKEIDRIDRELIALLARRLRIVRAIGQQKKKIGARITDKTREQEMAVVRQQLGRRLGIDGRFLEDVYRHIVADSKRIQNRL